MSLNIVGLKTNPIFMLTYNIFTIIKENVIKIAKFMIKEQVCFLFKMSIKFNDT